MFVVWIGSVVTTISAVVQPSVLSVAVAVWLWLTVLFGNLAEAVAEGRGKAQADTLRKARTETQARLLTDDGRIAVVPSSHLMPGRPGAGQRRGDHPRRRGRRRRGGQRRRVGDHRRVGPGDPGGRRGPVGGDRRHDRAVG